MEALEAKNLEIGGRVTVNGQSGSVQHDLVRSSF